MTSCEYFESMGFILIFKKREPFDAKKLSLYFIIYSFMGKKLNLFRKVFLKRFIEILQMGFLNLSFNIKKR